MTSQAQQPDSGNSDNQPEPNASPAPVDGDVESTQNPQPSTHNPQGDSASNYQPTIIVNIPEQNSGTDATANEIARDANKASWASVKVNGILLGVTLVVAFISIWQGCMTREAIKIANKTYLADSSNNERVYIRDSLNKIQSDIADAAKLKRDTDFVNKQKSGIDAQIKAFKETQKEFEKENQPYLIAKDLEKAVFKAGSRVSFDYKVYNYGKQPVKITHEGSTILFIPKRDSISFIKKPFTNLDEWSDASEYIGAYPRIHHFKTFILTADAEYRFNNGDYLVYLVGRIEYVNIITKRKRRYDYLLKIAHTQTDGDIWRNVYNENYDVK